MVKDHFTVQEVAGILDIYECSAREMLDGVIKFTRGELAELAAAKGLTVEALTAK